MNQLSRDAVKPPVRRKWLRKLLLSFLIGCALLLGYFSTTRVEGIEFEAHTWQVRVFSFRADPWTSWQWTGIRHDSSSWSVNPAIIAHLDGELSAGSRRWDLAGISRLGTRQPGPARSIVQLLTLYGYTGTGKPRQFWLDWTNRNPQRAKLFWPAIQHLTVCGAYNEIPEIVGLSLAELDDTQFFQSLKKEMSRALYRRAEELSSKREFSDAVTAAHAGLTYDPDCVELIELIDRVNSLSRADQPHDE